MNFKNFKIYIICNFCALNLAAYLDIAQLGYEQYQDIIINNQVVKPANYEHRHCDLRYQIIKKILDKYQRPFTMLDIGASQGYYSFRTAFNYNCVCVMIEGNNRFYPLIGSQLLDLCKANTSLKNIILLNKQIVTSDLQRLSECEHFDVVLAMNIIHWFPEKWQEIIDSILDMGDNIIIELPPKEQIPEIFEKIENYLKTKNFSILGYAPRHSNPNLNTTFYLIESYKKEIIRKTWISSRLCKNIYEITSNFSEKYLIKHINNEQSVKAPWLTGINLLTFKMYNGAYPEKKELKEKLSSIADPSHNDWMINNMILQGNKISLIDRDLNVKVKYTKELYNHHCKLIDIDNPEEVNFYFWNNLVPYKLTQEQSEKQVVNKKWSILICAIDERKQVFERLFNKLQSQIKINKLEDKIEVLFFKDNHEYKVGHKRNKLLEQSKGEYICFIDDVDDIHDNYIKMIYDKLLKNPDCVKLIGIKIFNSRNPKKFIHSIAYKTWFEKKNIHFRPPSHLNPIKRDIAKRFKFSEKDIEEDRAWAIAISNSGLVKKEEIITEPYYYLLK